MITCIVHMLCVADYLGAIVKENRAFLTFIRSFRICQEYDNQLAGCKNLHSHSRNASRGNDHVFIKWPEYCRIMKLSYSECGQCFERKVNSTLPKFLPFFLVADSDFCIHNVSYCNQITGVACKANLRIIILNV